MVIIRDFRPFSLPLAAVLLLTRCKDTEFSETNNMKQGKNTEISARLAEMLENAGLTANSFAAKLEYPRSQTIYDILNGKSSPSCDFFRRFLLSEYSEIYDIDWLITGEGSMKKRKGALTARAYRSYQWKQWLDASRESKQCFCRNVTATSSLLSKMPTSLYMCAATP